jgi:hypothetical protein
MMFNQTDKPCKICYSRMRKVKGGYECPRHGFFVEVKKERS